MGALVGALCLGHDLARFKEFPYWFTNHIGSLEKKMNLKYFNAYLINIRLMDYEMRCIKRSRGDNCEPINLNTLLVVIFQRDEWISLSH